MNKAEKSICNMAGFIRSQSLILIEKIEQLDREDLDHVVEKIERLHEYAEAAAIELQSAFDHTVETIHTD